MNDDTFFVKESLGSGGKGSFGELIKRYEAPIITLIYHLVGNFEDACDLAQETFIKAYQALKELKEPAKFSSWLRKIAFNTAMDWLRRHTKKNLSYEKLEGRIALESDDALLKNELCATVRKEIGKLPEEQRAVVVLRYLEELSYQEIAEILHLPMGTVRSRLSRARENLRENLHKAVSSR